MWCVIFGVYVQGPFDIVVDHSGQINVVGSGVRGGYGVKFIGYIIKPHQWIIKVRFREDMGGHLVAHSSLRYYKIDICILVITSSPFVDYLCYGGGVAPSTYLNASAGGDMD